METPIFDFVENYSKKGTTRFHMPGHKGIPFLGCENRDITEIMGADALYEAEGIIRRSEENATLLFGTESTFYATGGSTQCIGAMLYLALLHRKKENDRPMILAGRNAHKAFLHSCALLDLDVVWLYPKKEGESLCACPITAEEVEESLSAMEHLPIGIYLTSPDYLGNMADIQGVGAVCRKWEIPLLVDNAHGAYLRFLEPSLHPMDLGADLCCDSVHKTLPVLTGGAYLHVSKNAQRAFAREGKKALSLFGSTSPSYLTLQSLDLCNAYLAGTYRKSLKNTIETLSSLKQRLTEKGVVFCGEEPLKVVLDGKAIGQTGTELAECLREKGIEGEFADQAYLVLMATPENTVEDFRRLEKGLESILLKPLLENSPVSIPKGLRRRTVREAVFAPQETISVKESLGRICGTAAVSCPPAIPIAVSGEEVNEDMISLFLQYHITEISVVKE